MTKKIPIGVSGCLLGEEVRFNGAHSRDKFICNELSDHFEFRSFCPELSIGMGVPRKPVRLIARDGEIDCVGSDDETLNVTQPLRNAAINSRPWIEQLSGYILKKGSPSCGMERVKVYGEKRTEFTGVGIFAEQLMRDFPLLPVEEEGRLNDIPIRENFIRRVYVYDAWRSLEAQGVSLKALMRFHGRLKYVLYSHHQNRARDLGRRLSQTSKSEAQSFASHYIEEAMAILRLRATRKNHTNVLHHLQGYLKRRVDATDKLGLVEAISQYRQGLVPLIVPLELLRHMFRRHPNEYLSDSFYLQPYPREFCLLNKI